MYVLLIFGGMASSAPDQQAFARLVGSQSMHQLIKPKDW
jgi:hypothetical protein